MSITGDIYNIDQSLTGEGVTDLELNTLIVDDSAIIYNSLYLGSIETYTDEYGITNLKKLSGNILIPRLDGINFDVVPLTTLLNIRNLTSDAQLQLNQRAKLLFNNEFTGSLNKFNSIECSNNVKTLTINNTPANYFEGTTSNLQQQINALTTGSPINGQSATVSIGTTTTLSAGSNATVTNTGTNLDAVFNFGVPQGIQGLPGITPTISVNPIVDNLVSGSTPYVILTTDALDPNNKILKFGLVRGSQGLPGNDGITPTFSIGTVTDLNSGSTPTVTIANDTRIDTNGNLLYPNNKVISFSLVKGSKGDKGEEGAKGDKGEQGKQGDKGDTGSGADATSIAGLVLGGAGLVVSIGTLLGLFTGLLGNGLATGVEGAVAGTLVERVIVLEQKTTGLTFDFANIRSTFDHTIQVSNLLGPTVRLNAFEQSTFYYGLNVPIVGLPIVGGIVSAVSLNKALPSAFNLGIITTGITAGAIGCASVTIISPIGGFFDVTGVSNFLGNVDIEGETNFVGAVTIEGETNIVGAVTVEGETNFAGAVTMQGSALFEAEANFAGAVTIEAVVNITGDTSIEGAVEVIGGSITQTQINDTETGLPIPLSNTLFDTSINGNITQVNLLPNNPLHTPPTTTLLDTTVKSLTIEDGDITQLSGTTSVFDLTVTGTNISIGDNFENNVINIGNSQSTMTLEGETISIGVGTLANTINIGNSLTTLTLKSLTNNPINVENAFNQFQEEFNTELEQLINEFNFLY